METLTEQLHSPAVCEEDQNGSVTVDDLDHIQKVNRELEQQLSDKNRVRCFSISILSSPLNSVSEGTDRLLLLFLRSSSSCSRDWQN